MYASKRRQRNFKRVREPQRQPGTSNPSKRHRERLNGELETVACLLPYDQSTISRLDKLSVLRLAVAYLQVKAHFSACVHSSCGFLPPPPQPSSTVSNQSTGLLPLLFTHAYQFIPSPNPFSAHIPTLVDAATGIPLIDSEERFFEMIAMKALGGFVLVLNNEGDVFYVSENVEAFLGFHQSDILHQSLFELIHSEDREDIRQQLDPSFGVPPGCSSVQDLLTSDNLHCLERNVNARFRCLLDNTCGFLRMDVRGKLLSLHGVPSTSFLVGARAQSSTILGLVAICTPFVPPSNSDLPTEDLILKSKHQLDNTLISMDPKMHHILELSEADLPKSFYSLIHPEDAICMAEAHKEVSKNGSSGLLIYRIIAAKSRRTYFVQSSCRMFYKNAKADSIGLTHRVLNEVEGSMLLEKRSSLKAKLLSFDDSLLQSPRNLQSAAALPSIGALTTGRLDEDDEENSRPGNLHSQQNSSTDEGCPSKSPPPPISIPSQSLSGGKKRKTKTKTNQGDEEERERREGNGPSTHLHQQQQQQQQIWVPPLQTIHSQDWRCEDQVPNQMIHSIPSNNPLPSEILHWPATQPDWTPIEHLCGGIYSNNFQIPAYPPLFQGFPEMLPGLDYHHWGQHDSHPVNTQLACGLEEHPSVIKHHPIIPYPLGDKKLQETHLVPLSHPPLPSIHQSVIVGPQTIEGFDTHHPNTLHPIGPPVLPGQHLPPANHPTPFASFISEATNALLGPLPI